MKKGMGLLGCVCCLILIMGCANTSSLHVAAVKGDSVKAEMLIEKGVDVNKTTHGGETPLHFAAHGGSIEVIELLLDGGADINAQSKKERLTPLHKAALWDNLDAVKLLLDRGAEINAVDKMGETPLFKAAYRNNVEVANFLKAKGGLLYSGMEMAKRECRKVSTRGGWYLEK